MATAYDATTRHAIYVERLKARAVRDVLDLLRPLSNDIFATVAASDLENLTRREVQSLVASLNRMIKAGYEPVIDEINGALREYGFYEGGWNADMLQRTGLVADIGVASDADIWAAVNANPFDGRFLKGWLDGLPAGTARRVREAVTQGYADGRGALDVARDLRGTRARKGILDMSARGAETMGEPLITTRQQRRATRPTRKTQLSSLSNGFLSWIIARHQSANPETVRFTRAARGQGHQHTRLVGQQWFRPPTRTGRD